MGSLHLPSSADVMATTGLTDKLGRVRWQSGEFKVGPHTSGDVTWHDVATSDVAQSDVAPNPGPRGLVQFLEMLLCIG